jgi:hypothetical protein
MNEKTLRENMMPALIGKFIMQVCQLNQNVKGMKARESVFIAITELSAL